MGHREVEAPPNQSKTTCFSRISEKEVVYFVSVKVDQFRPASLFRQCQMSLNYNIKTLGKQQYILYKPHFIICCDVDCANQAAQSTSQHIILNIRKLYNADVS